MIQTAAAGIEIADEEIAGLTQINHIDRSMINTHAL